MFVLTNMQVSFPIQAYIMPVAYLQEERTVESILEEIKSKHDAAAAQLQAAGQGAQTAATELDMIRAAQKDKMDSIKTLCRYVNAEQVLFFGVQ